MKEKIVEILTDNTSLTIMDINNLLSLETLDEYKTLQNNLDELVSDGIIYYSDNNNDLGNFENYEDFLSALKAIMKKGYDCLRDKKYASIIISDFTVEKKEICVQADIVKMMQDIGFQYVGTTVLLQTVKPLYPFGYPYAYKINHHHQNIISFRKDIILK